MTSPGSGIDLQPLWVPVMPETSHLAGKLKEEVTKAGREAGRSLENALNPDQLGNAFGQKFTAAFSRHFSQANFGYGIGTAFDKLTEQVDARLASKLKTQLPNLTREYESATRRLTQAEQEAAAATQRLAQMHEINSRNIAGSRFSAADFIPVLRQQAQAQKEVEESTTRVNTAHERLTSTQQNYQAASARSFTMGSAFAGMLGGATVLGIQAVIHGMEKIVELGVHMFEGAVRGAEELASKLIEVGEDYEHLSIQVREYSDASGPALEALQGRVEKIFSTLDVAGKNTGQTFAQLGSMIGDTGPELDTLTKRTEELQGRFTNLKASDLGSIFYAFNLNAAQGNQALGSMLQSAQRAGQGLGDLANIMSGDVAFTMKETGLSIAQVADFAAQLEKSSIPARAAMMGLGGAQKEFSKSGMDFATGMRYIAEVMPTLSKADQDILSQGLFGRRWIDAKKMVELFNAELAKTPEELAAAPGYVDDFLVATEDLGNKIQRIRHGLEDLFKPVGMTLVSEISRELDKVPAWFAQHHHEIINHIHSWGLAFIENIPRIQEFVANGVHLFGYFASIVKGMFISMAEPLLQAVWAWGKLSFNKDLARDASAMIASLDKIDAIDLEKVGDKGANMIKAWRPPLDEWATDLDKSLQKADTTWDHQKGQVDEFSHSLRDATDNIHDLGDAMGTMPKFQYFPPGTSALPNPTGPGGAPPIPGAPLPGAPGSKTNPLQPNNLGGLLGAPSGYSGGGHANWAAIAGAESGGNWQITYGEGTPDNPVSGGLQIGDQTWAGHGGLQYGVRRAYMATPEQQIAVAERVLADQGPKAWPVTFRNHPDWFGATQAFQTGGLVQPSDLAAARGGLATANVSPSYGGSASGGMGKPRFPKWWSDIIDSPADEIPGWMPPFDLIQGNPWSDDPRFRGGMSPGGTTKPSPWEHFNTGGLSGTDTVPAWLTPGEYVWNTKAVDKYGGLIDLLNGKARGFAPGGPVDQYHDPSGNDIVGVNPQIASITAVANQFGLTLTAGKSGHGTHAIDGLHHDFGEAGDFGNGVQTDAELAFAQYMFTHFGSELAELIHNDPRMPQLIGNGQVVDGMQYYGPKTMGEHKDHVHVAIRAQQVLSDQLQPGSQPLAVPGAPVGQSGVPTGIGVSGGVGSSSPLGFGIPGLGVSGGGGGGLGGGGETYDQYREHQEAVERAQHDQGEAQYREQQALKDRDDKKDKLDELRKGKPGKPGLPGMPPAAPTPATPEEINAAEEALASANHNLASAQWEAGQAGNKVADSLRKQSEAALKPPKRGRGGAAGASEFEQLGSSFLSGLGQALGFGDILGKAPWDFGAFKLFTGIAGMGMSWADELMNGGQGGQNGAVGPSGGLFQGLSSSLGMNMPKATFQAPGSAPASISTGVGVIPTQSATSGMDPRVFGHGGPGNPAPGPLHIDNSVNVTNNGPNQSDYQTWKEASNAQAPAPVQYSPSQFPHP